MNINQIFAPNRHPCGNYIKRDRKIDHGKLDKTIPNGNTHVVGPPDTGRSSIVQHHLTDSYPLVVNGGKVTTTGDVFSHLLNSLTSKPIPPRHEIPESDLQSITRSEEFVRGAVKDRIETGHYTLVFDDFDKMPSKVREYVADWIEAYVDTNVGITTIVSDDNKDAVYEANPNLRDQLTVTHVPEWGQPNLKQIGKIGFETVGAPMRDPTLDGLADMAEGSPTRMHELCLEMFIDIATEREYDIGQDYLPNGVK